MHSARYYYQHRNPTWTVWNVNGFENQGIYLIPKCASSQIRRSFHLSPALFTNLERVWVPIRPVRQRFVSSIVEFLCRCKRASDDGAGSIGLDDVFYDLLRLDQLFRWDCEEIISNFLDFFEEVGFIDPHFYPQTYFVSEVNRFYDHEFEFVDITCTDSMNKFWREFGLVRPPLEKSNQRSKGVQYRLRDLYPSMLRKSGIISNARTHTFWGRNGIGLRYSNLITGRKKVEKFYSECTNVLENNEALRSKVDFIYSDDFGLFPQACSNL